MIKMVPSMGKSFQNGQSISHTTLVRRRRFRFGNALNFKAEQPPREIAHLRCGAAKAACNALSGRQSRPYNEGHFWGERMSLIPASVVEKNWRAALSRLEAER